VKQARSLKKSTSILYQGFAWVSSPPCPQPLSVAAAMSAAAMNRSGVMHKWKQKMRHLELLIF
jgi:hypothetical protein